MPKVVGAASSRDCDTSPLFFSASCRGKVRHRTRRHARIAVKRMWRFKRERVYAYHCNFCGCWHTGHRRPATSRKRRQSREVIFYE